MNLDKVHLIKGENNENILFYYPTFGLLAINDMVYSILQKLRNKVPKEELIRDFSISEIQLSKLLNSLNNSLSDCQNIEEEKKYDGRYIKRITLHVSNDCNLRCRYCYASGGSYQLPRKLMTQEMASDFLSFCFNSFDNIGSIVFFGGEPLMNVEVINYICEKFTSYYKESKISYLPKFGIITNGTIVNEAILQLIQKYITTITVSIDGPKDVNDYNRKFANGNGSYEKIAKFICEVKEKTPICPEYEATYTPYHEEKGMEEIDQKSFFKKEFDINGSVIREMNFMDFSEGSYLKMREKDSIRQENGLSFPEGFFSIVNALLYKKSKEMCLVGDHTVAISVDGDIYPCHLNTGMKNVSLGNINENNIFNQKEYYIEKFPYLQSIRKDNASCMSCWAQRLCGGCTYKWFFDEKKKEYSIFPNFRSCESNRKHIEQILILITHLKRSEKKWSELLELLKTKDESYFNG